MADDLETLTPAADGADLGGGGADPGAGPDTSRSDVERAFEQVEAREGLRDAPLAPAKGDPAAPPAGSSEGRARGPDGRFAPERPAPAAEKALGAPDKPAPMVGDKQPPDASQRAPERPEAARPPVSWKAPAREHWAKLPAEVQQEVSRREGEITRVMRESSQAREALQHVQGVIGPYAQNIAASGSDALGWIENFAKADNTLRHGSIVEKAQLAANIIKQYGVDIQALDSVLAGQHVQPDPNAAALDQVRREIDQRLQPMMGYFGQLQARQQQAAQRMDSQVASEVQQFSEKAEFYEDVRQDMADILELATRRGIEMPLQEAYDRAIVMNPQLREIVNRRQQAERATTQQQAAQRARRAAASLTSSPAPAGSPGLAGDDRRSVIEAAWDSASSS